jgi:hypothetical protein
MFPAHRRHPLQTFRFWFLVMGAVTVTIAWRLDLLPVRIGPAETGRLADEVFTDVELPDQIEPGDLVLSPDRPSSARSDLADADAPPFHAGEPAPASPHDSPSSASAAAAAAGSAEPESSERLALLEATLEELADLSNAESALHRVTTPVDAPVDAPTAAAAPASTGFDGLADDWHLQSRVRQTANTDSSGHPARGAAVAAANEPVQTLASAPVDFNTLDRLILSERTDDHVEAHRQLSTLYWQHAELRGDIRSRIESLAQRIYFQPQPHYLDAHQVEPSELLQSIASHYSVSWQYLAKLNRVDPQRIRPGQRLKVIKGPFSAVVDLSDFEMTVHAHGYFVTRFPVGIGKDGSTPLGTFTVQEKLVNPTYYGPEGVIPHDDPQNPLGERWIDLGDSYGIHGTIDANSIGKRESRGCIRMHNDDVAAVYDLLTISSEVVIRE